MSIFLDRVDAAPIVNKDFDAQFLQWIWVLVDTLNEDISDIQNALNFLTAQNAAFLTESVTLTSSSPIFSVVNGALYTVGDNVIGNGIPINSNILTIVGNVITISSNATLNGVSALTFIPLQGDIGNGILLYDTTNNVYVGMQSGALVKFTTTAYP